MNYLEKIEKNPYADLYWNIPEAKRGAINIIGGNSQNFRTSVKVAEFLTKNYPLRSVNTILPDTLREKLPAVDGLIFCESTDTGSFAKKEEILGVLQSSDFNIMIGDFSKNNVTMRAVAGAINEYSNTAQKTNAPNGESSALQSSATPLLITRDSVDILAEHQPEKALLNEELILLASMPQLQKLLRAIYYPKMLMMSQSLVQVAETLHKFTLSYPCKIIALHLGQVLIAFNGKVVAMPVEKSGYSPMMFWNGEIAAKIVALNLYNPNQFIQATVAGIFKKD